MQTLARPRRTELRGLVESLTSSYPRIRTPSYSLLDAQPSEQQIEDIARILPTLTEWYPPTHTRLSGIPTLEHFLQTADYTGRRALITRALLHDSIEDAKSLTEARNRYEVIEQILGEEKADAVLDLSNLGKLLRHHIRNELGELRKSLAETGSATYGIDIEHTTRLSEVVQQIIYAQSDSPLYDQILAYAEILAIPDLKFGQLTPQVDLDSLTRSTRKEYARYVGRINSIDQITVKLSDILHNLQTADSLSDNQWSRLLSYKVPLVVQQAQSVLDPDEVSPYVYFLAFSVIDEAFRQLYTKRDDPEFRPTGDLTREEVTDLIALYESDYAQRRDTLFTSYINTTAQHLLQDPGTFPEVATRRATATTDLIQLAESGRLPFEYAKPFLDQNQSMIATARNHRRSNNSLSTTAARLSQSTIYLAKTLRNQAITSSHRSPAQQDMLTYLQDRF